MKSTVNECNRKELMFIAFSRFVKIEIKEFNKSIELPFISNQIKFKFKMSDKYSRTNYLAIDKDVLKRHRGRIPFVDYFLRKSSQIEICPLNQKFPVTLGFGNARYSVDKIGTKLNIEKWGKLEFNLNDPYLTRSRVPITYYRFHDPGLISYFNRKPIRNKMIMTNYLTTKNDAIISRKEFFEIAKYVEMRKCELYLNEEAERVISYFMSSFTYYVLPYFLPF